MTPPELTMRQCRVILGEWHMGIRPQRVVLYRCPDCFVEVSAEGRRCRQCRRIARQKARCCPDCQRAVSEPGRKCHRCAHAPRISSKRAEAVERYKQGETSTAIAKDMGLSRERVCQYLRAEPSVTIRPSGVPKKTCGPSGGGLSRDERNVWRRNQKQLHHLLEHRQIVRLYRQGLGCMDIAQQVPRLSAYDILKLLRRAGVTIRPVGTYDHSRRAAPRRYPWDLWLDGQTWTLEHGVDFMCKPHCLRQNAYVCAKRRDKSARVSIQGGAVTITATTRMASPH